MKTLGVALAVCVAGAASMNRSSSTCADSVEGPWSDPWYVNSSGFDPSLFHDDDGRRWFVNMQLNHRWPGSGRNPVHDRFDGILLQEWSPERGAAKWVEALERIAS